jgi:hypothetical protein
MKLQKTSLQTDKAIIELLKLKRDKWDLLALD